MADTWIMDISAADGAVYRVLCAHPVRNGADLDELKVLGAELLNGGAFALRAAGVSAASDAPFVLIHPRAVTSIVLRQHNFAPDPLAVVWSVETPTPH